jgi:ribosomal protein L6P/L9E
MKLGVTSSNTNNINKKWGHYSLFSKVMIIRGIGYRAYYISNDLCINNDQEFLYSKYLLIRAGHTSDLYIGLPKTISIKISKKDRKLVIYGPSKILVSAIHKKIVTYRKPSVYTGRGIRTKGSKPIRKAGKKDKQKGKAY